PARPRGPAGLSRLRLPFRHPGRGRGGYRRTAGGHRRGRAAAPGGVEQRRARPEPAIARQPVGDDDPLDHVADHLVERPVAQPHRHDGAARVAADRPPGVGDAGRAPERGDGEAGGARRRPQPPCRLGEAQGRGARRAGRGVSARPVGRARTADGGREDRGGGAAHGTSFAPGCDSHVRLPSPLVDRRQFLLRSLGVLGAAAAGAVAPPWAGAAVAGRRHPQHHRAGPTTTTAPADTTTAPGGLVAPWIQAENAKPGTGQWVLTRADGLVQGFADASSVNRGERVAFKISSAAPTYRLEGYRMGWYQGLGARQVWTSGALPGFAQQPARVVPGVNMVDCSHWETTYELTLDDRFPPGVYLFRVVGDNGSDWFVPLTVRDDASRARFLMVNAVTEWQAYNEYGNYSLYFGLGPRGRNFDSRARIVSFDRPYANGAGSGDFIGLEHPLVMRLEEQGFDVTYATSIDLHANPDLLQRHTAFLSPGHDEYW